ncbi:MFS transporter [Sphingomonas guangdongensis]|uniref:MFS transporter n=1 Tax=Sphingomonas guangdongensis TaxID=1141890 RepID=UPI000BE366AB|nr:MFS transporter [Sphingomonas guangdongensis]
MSRLAPQPTLTEAEREGGLRLLVREAAFSGGTAALTTGVILTAFALHLGASNIMVGVLASAPFLAQLLQLPAIGLVERWRRRKLIAVGSSLIGRAMLAVMAVLAFTSGTPALLIFLAAQLILCGFGAVGTCAWNAWMRDLAPDERLRQVFARRTVWLSLISLLLGLVAALALDLTPAGSEERATVFAGMFAIGCLTGLISAWMVAAMPEPAMPAAAGPVQWRSLLGEPLADPFFTVFIVWQLRFPISFVMLDVVSQVANIAAVRLWRPSSAR